METESSQTLSDSADAAEPVLQTLLRLTEQT